VHAQVIAVDNVLVRPGDYILADDDGVVVIPMGVAPKIAELAIEYGAFRSCLTDDWRLLALGSWLLALGSWLLALALVLLAACH
jgi:hypothetical protein